ncbi:MAG: hypothetical protein Q8891_13820 [Bacteroidota bacterium]|nr:hypothetical protein [Bacteroidota bacterium]
MIKEINKLLGKAGFQIKKNIALESEKVYYRNTIKCLEDLYNYRCTQFKLNLNEQIIGIVFSKNRAMQLHALISSYFYYTENVAPLKVIFTTDNEQHKKSYQILKEEFSTLAVEFICENDFKAQLKSIVQKTEADRIFFMTDDAIFLDEYNLSNVLKFNPLKTIFSLRLGKNINFSFTHNKVQGLPKFKSLILNSQILYEWIWKNMSNSPDWYYPLSVDANIFSKNEIDIIIKYIDFNNPNTFEASLQIFINVFLPRKGVCYENAKYVNIPCNIVQNDFENIYTGTFSVSELLKLFLEGKRINWKLYKGIDAISIQKSKYDFI